MVKVKCLVAFCSCLPIPMVAAATDWPEGYVAHEDSTSPDGQYGIVVAGSEETSEAGDSTNYLGNVKTHQVLAKIDSADYFEQQNHRHLSVIWSSDSKRCVARYDGRFGFDVILILELQAPGFAQVDLTEHIEKSLMSAAGEQGQGSAFFQFAPGDKLLVRALYYTGNPKLMDERTKQARFAGTFDIKSKKWIASESHKTKEWEALSSAYAERGGQDILVRANGAEAPEDSTGTVVSSEEEKAEKLDEVMNNVYGGVRAVLAPGRFSKVHEEQIAWLKKRDAASSAAEKGKLLEARIKVLQSLLW